MLTHRLKVARKNKKLTQEQLAKLVRTTKGTISNYENGYSTPSNDMLVLLAKSLDTSTDYLLGNDEIIENKEFEEWLNNPDLNVFYRELPKSEDEKIRQLREIWEIIKKQ